MPCFVIRPELKNWFCAPKPVLGDAARQDRVLRLVVEVREVDAEPVAEHARLEAQLESLDSLGLQVLIAERVGREDALPVRPSHRRQRLQGGVECRLLSGRAVRPAEPEAAEGLRQPPLHPGILAGDVRDARLRVPHPLHVATERAVVVHSCRARDVEAVLPPELLLGVIAERVVAGPAVGETDLRAGGANGLEPGCGEEITLPLNELIVSGIVLRT